MNVISDFRGEYEFLSNSYPCLLIVDNEAYPSLEHAFQASKTDDLNLKIKIRDALTAHDAKKIGINVPLIQDWDQKRLDVMASLIREKFSTHLDLKCQLLLTGTKELIQGNTYKDRFWGQDKSGAGDNNLGKILMMVRESIRVSEGGPFQVLIKFLEDKKLSSMTKKLNTLKHIVETFASSDAQITDDLTKEIEEIISCLK